MCMNQHPRCPMLHPINQINTQFSPLMVGLQTFMKLKNSLLYSKCLASNGVIFGQIYRRNDVAIKCHHIHLLFERVVGQLIRIECHIQRE